MKKFEIKTIQTDFPKVKVESSLDSANVIRQFYSDDIEIFESVFILLLNNANMTIAYAKISQGGITGTVVDIRIIAKYAVESLCTGVVMAHNHPSGNLKPSQQDLEISKKVYKALELFDIKLIDSLILTKDDYSAIEFQ